MNKGTVKAFDEVKGFGIIVDDNTKEEFFVHVSGLIDPIQAGDEVIFNTLRTIRGLHAIGVQLA